MRSQNTFLLINLVVCAASARWLRELRGILNRQPKKTIYAGVLIPEHCILASCTSGLTYIKKSMKIYVIDGNNFNIRVSHSGLDHLVTDFVTFCVNLYLFVLSCTSCCCAIFSRNLQTVVHDAIPISNTSSRCI